MPKESRLENADWVRREIAHALETGVNVVPILWGDFQFPAPGELPGEIEALARQNAVRCSHESFEGAVEKLKEFLR